MKKYLLILPVVAAAVSASAQDNAATPPTASGIMATTVRADRNVFFDINATGKRLPIIWGFDTAWNSYDNMLRGLRHAGYGTVGVARVSFQPWAVVTEPGRLPQTLLTNLKARLANVALCGRKVDIALNLDGGENTVKETYGYLDENNNYIGNPESVAYAYANLIDATVAAVRDEGYNVVSVAPFNEPDYFWNGTPIDVFHLINQKLKNTEEYPRMSGIRISGGNTLNCDQALPWYEHLKDFLDEGNTHQLAGDFDHYADFFKQVREDGKHASADELHNVMEAMVGVEYGMQTGIWWGTAEQARGEFCKASGGERLGYAENRDAWSAASVYRNPSGKIQAFLGCSERQAKPSTYKFVSTDGPVYINGRGPVREYVVALPGDPEGAYQTEKQRNAETMLNISNSADIQPVTVGDFVIVNGQSQLVMSGKNGNTANGTELVVLKYTGADAQHWTVSDVPYDIGGDFSYSFIRNTADRQALDDKDWHLEEGSQVCLYGPSNNSVQQWTFEYDGDGWFHIRNKHSALYLDINSNSNVVQNDRSDSPTQRWRLVPQGAPLVFDKPAAPAGVAAELQKNSVLLKWDATDGMTYNIQRSRGDDAFIAVADSVTSGTFLDNSVYEGNEYTYKVVACDRSGNRSEASQAVSVSVPASRTLLAEYPLDTDASDISGNMLDMVHPMAFSTRNGRVEGTKAFYMRTNQFLQFPYGIFDRDAFTLAMWVNRQSDAEGSRIMAMGNDSAHQLYLSGMESGRMRLVARNGENEAAIATTALKSRTWSHVAVVVDGSNATLYIDGEPVSATADFAEAMPGSRVLGYLGRDIQTLPAYIGCYEDVRVYNYALDAAGVKSAMTSDSGITDVAVDNATVAAVEYYTLQGVRLSAPSETSITIRRTVYTDGTTRTVKLLPGK